MKILLIDDSSTFLKLIIGIFDSDGYDVKGVSTIEQAEVEIKNSLPKLIILDLFLKDDNGFNFLSKIKKDSKTKNIPVLIVSSLNKPEIIKKAMRMGAADYINKPINIQDIKNKCKLFLKT